MTALSKNEITSAVVKSVGVSKQDAAQAVEHFFNVLSALFAEGKAVKLSGFGNFSVKSKKARPGRNPKTGHAVEICARRVLTFKAGLKLKKQIESDVKTK